MQHNESSIPGLIDKICDQFEDAWKNQSPLKIEDLLLQVPESHREKLLTELLQLEIHYRRQNGEDWSVEDYTKRFTDQSATVSSLLAALVEDSDVDRTLPPKSTPVVVDEDATIASAGVNPIVRPATKIIRYFGQYELLREIARGGMGVVYEARQVSLNRIVALKMILSGQLASEEEVLRFRTEAEAAANLDHPGIVPIFEIGEHEGQHYFSMGFVRGRSLADRIAEGPLTPTAAAELLQKICDAMSYAHQRGVIHRDLKPANILLDADGQPKVTDFGLAKKTEADSNLTGTGQILGTPTYMAPEQARGDADIGPSADIYAIGAILYCLLTGRPPHQAANPMETLIQVLEKEPISPCQLSSGIPTDLETICLKCLSKEVNKRYESSEDLRAELRRFLDGEPILARPVSRIERAWRWSKRHPAIAALTSIVALLTIILAIGGPVVAVSQIRLRNEAEQNEKKAIKNEQRAKENAQRALASEKLAIENEKKANLLAASERKLKEQAEQRRNELALEKEKNVKSLHAQYGRSIALAYQAWQDGNLTSTKEILNSFANEFRGFEWDFVYSLCHMEIQKFHGMRNLPQFVEFASDGIHVIAAPKTSIPEEGKVFIWRNDSSRPIRIHNAAGHAVSHDGEKLAISTAELRDRFQIIESLSGEVICEGAGHKGGTTHVAFGGVNNSLVATTGRDQMIRIWDAKNGQQLLEIKEKNRDRLHPLALSPDGSLVAWRRADDGVVEIRETADGAVRFQGEPRLREAKQELPVAFSPDNKILAAGANGEVQLFRTRDGTQIGRLQGGRGFTLSLGYSPSGDRLAVTCQDGSVRIYDTAEQRLITTLTGHDIGQIYGITSVAFDKTGDRIASGGADKIVKVWDAWNRDRRHQKSREIAGINLSPPSQASDFLSNYRGNVESLEISDDGKTLVGAGADKSVRVFDLESGEPLREWTDLDGRIAAVDFHQPTGLVVAGVGGPQARRPGDVIAFNIQQRDEVWRFTDTQGPIRAISLFDAGKKVAVCVGSHGVTVGELFVLDADSGELLWKNETPVLSVFDLAVSPDGSWIATVGRDVGITIWDASTGQRQRNFGQRHLFALDVSPDGTTIAAGSSNWEVALFVVDSGENIWTERRHSGAVTDVKFADNGTRVVSVAIDGTTRIWNARYGNPILTLQESSVPKYAIAVAKDTNVLAVSGDAPEIILHRSFNSIQSDEESIDPANWTEIWSEDFEQEDLERRWRPIIGKWDLNNGKAVGTLGSNPWQPSVNSALIMPNRLIPGEAEIEFDVRVDHAMVVELKFVDQGGQNSLSARYVGVIDTPINQGKKGVAINHDMSEIASNRELRVDLEPNRDYKFAVRRDKRGVQVSIDGAIGATAQIPIGVPLPHLQIQGFYGPKGSKIILDNIRLSSPPSGAIEIEALKVFFELAGRHRLEPLVIQAIENHDFSAAGDPEEMKRVALDIAKRWPDNENEFLGRIESEASKGKESSDTFRTVYAWLKEEYSLKNERIHRVSAMTAYRAEDLEAALASRNKADRLYFEKNGSHHPIDLALELLIAKQLGNADSLTSHRAEIEQIMLASHWRENKNSMRWWAEVRDALPGPKLDATAQQLSQTVWHVTNELITAANIQPLRDQLAENCVRIAQRNEDDPRTRVETDRETWLETEKIWYLSGPPSHLRLVRTSANVDMKAKQPSVTSRFVLEVPDGFYAWVQRDFFLPDNEIEPKNWKITRRIVRNETSKIHDETFQMDQDGIASLNEKVEQAKTRGDPREVVLYLTLAGRNKEALKAAWEAAEQDPSAAWFAKITEFAYFARDPAAMRKAAIRAIELDPSVNGPPFVRALAARKHLNDEPVKLPDGINVRLPSFFRPVPRELLNVADPGTGQWMPSSDSLVGIQRLDVAQKKIALENLAQSIIIARENSYGINLISRGRRMVGGQKAVDFVSAGRGIGRAVLLGGGVGRTTVQRFVIVRHEDTFFLILVTAYESEFPLRNAEFEQVLNTIEFEAPS